MPDTPPISLPLRPVRALAVLLTLVLSLLAAACGAGGSATSPTSPGSAAPATTVGGDGGGTFPVTITTPKGEVRIEKKPTRIVSLSPSATETLYAIGAGNEIVAVDRNSSYPQEAPRTDMSGFEPNIEAIAAKQPDLVVASNDTNNLVANLNKIGIPVLLNPAPKKIDDVYAGWADIGRATGHVAGTERVIATTKEGIAEAKKRAPKGVGLRVYHELESTYFSASSFSFIGSVYAEMGAQNIADEADTKKGGYPRLTEEAIITADPQLIVITDAVSYKAADVAARPGWQNVAAVKHGTITTVNADIASRWGPRLPELYQTLAEALESAKAKA